MTAALGLMNSNLESLSDELWLDLYMVIKNLIQLERRTTLLADPENLCLSDSPVFTQGS